MTKLIPFSTFSKNNIISKDGVSVVVKDDIPSGFLFNRDAFISFLEQIDEQFESLVDDPKKAFNNPAGKLIDLIEEKLPINQKFASELRSSVKKNRNQDWISLEEIVQNLHV